MLFRSAFMPFDRTTSSDIPYLTIHNEGTTISQVLISLKSNTGQTIASASGAIGADNVISGLLTNLFQLQPGGFALSGYVVIAAASPLKSLLINHPDSGQELVLGASSLGQTQVPMTFFVYGGPYNTALSLVNASSTAKAHFSLVQIGRAHV